MMLPKDQCDVTVIGDRFGVENKTACFTKHFVYTVPGTR